MSRQTGSDDIDRGAGGVIALLGMVCIFAVMSGVDTDNEDIWITGLIMMWILLVMSAGALIREWHARRGEDE